MVESVNYNFADVNHTHTEYAPVSHTHAQYADISHTHSGYSVTGHTHSQYAPLESPGFTGVPTAPTAPLGSNTTQVATTAFVQAATIAAGAVPDASTTVAGKIMIASAGDITSTDKATTPAAVASGLAAKADTGHSHVGYAASIHAHAVSDVTGLQGILDGKVTATYVSDRLAEFGGNTTAKLITDWNSVTGSGWYMANEFALNAPIANWCIGTVIVHNSEWQVQEVIAFSSNDESGNTGTWHREKNMNVWSAWHRVYKTAGEIASTISALNTYVTTAGNQTINGVKSFADPITVDGAIHIRGTESSLGIGAIALNNAYSNTFNNTAVGSSALRYTTTGWNNTALGAWTLVNNINGYNNTAVGAQALYDLEGGYGNTALGAWTLVNNINGHHNTAVGVESLYSNTGGYQNTAVGFESLYSNTDGIYNVAVGASSLYSNVGGFYNVAIGNGALSNSIDNSYNTAVGRSALWATNYYNCSAFGNSAQVNGSNQVQLGDSATTTYVYGTVQNRSDLRDKTDIRDTVLGLDFIESLRPVDYKWDMRDYYRTEMPLKPEIPTGATPEQIKEIEDEYKASLAEHLEANKPANLVRDGSKKRNRYHHGLIAQEVKALLDEKGIDFGGYQDHKVSGGEDVLSIGYDELIAPLIKAVQELSAQNNLLVQQLTALTARVDELTNK